MTNSKTAAAKTAAGGTRDSARALRQYVEKRQAERPSPPRAVIFLDDYGMECFTRGELLLVIPSAGAEQPQTAN